MTDRPERLTAVCVCCRCLTYDTLPAGCTLQKAAGECCSRPVCNGQAVTGQWPPLADFCLSSRPFPAHHVRPTHALLTMSVPLTPCSPCPSHSRLAHHVRPTHALLTMSVPLTPCSPCPSHSRLAHPSVIWLNHLHLPLLLLEIVVVVRTMMPMV